ncbi:MAG TPA: VWA domain-containing protein [Polyangiaceae bacterium]|nr:VWA domain-containing protein [Polyangiaceae bacterium]
MRTLALLASIGVFSSLLASGGVALAEPCDLPRIMIVMDSSSSMLNTVSEQNVDIVKWDAAQSAVKSVTDAYPDSAQWGLMVFPGPAGGCSTGTVLVDVGLSTGPDIQTQLANIDMSSGSRQTPAGQTLMAAAADPGITAAGKKNYVVFVTDGYQYCSVPAVSGPPVCTTSADCAAMNVSTCPTCDSCNTGSSDPACAGYAGGCYCIRTWPVLGVEALAAAGVKTYVVGFGSNVDAKTLNTAAYEGGTAIAGCDPSASTPSCYYKATLPSEFNAALADIVQKVTTETCTADCGIQGSRACTASGWSDCVAPTEVDCTGPCGASGKQKCVNGALTECDAVCEDAGAGGSAGAAGAAGAAGSGGAAGAAGKAGSGGSAGSAGKGGASSEDDAGDGTAGGAAAGPESGDDGGCGCRVAGSSSGSRTILALGLGIAFAALARARRRH